MVLAQTSAYLPDQIASLIVLVGDDMDDDQLGPERLGQPTSRVQHRPGRLGLVNRAENPVSHHRSPPTARAFRTDADINERQSTRRRTPTAHNP
jgi:hypothetical protein